MEQELPLAEPDDWGTLRRRGLTTVVDPMIYRAGELFCAGRQQAPDPTQTWDALSANLSGLSAFFDAMIHNEHLPIFEYGITIPEAEIVGAATACRLVPGVNVEDEILVPIRGHEPIYAPI